MLEQPRIAVSTVIFALNEASQEGVASLWIPLVRRIREPYLGMWALPGGLLDMDESLEEAARRNLKAMSGLVPRYLEQLYAFGDPARSSHVSDSVEKKSASLSGEARTVSIVYWAMVDSVEARGVAEQDNVRWFSVNNLPPMAFDHSMIMEYALWRVRNKVGYAQIAHQLLGKVFTLAQLRHVYESILGRSLDPANFRRQMLASGCLHDTGQVLMGHRYRPPRLYQYTDSPGLIPS